LDASIIVQILTIDKKIVVIFNYYICHVFM